MNTLDLYNFFRAQVVDTVAPFLWSDIEVYQYMDDAQKMFCRLTRGISDSTTLTDLNNMPLTWVPIQQGDMFVSISPLILWIREAQRDYDFQPLTILNFEDVTSGHYFVTSDQMSDYGGLNRPFLLDNVQGITGAIIDNMEQSKIRLVPVSNKAFNIQMTVYRLPLNTLTPSASPQSFEIDSQHHMHLALWMKYLAYNKQDADTFNRGKAGENKILFEEYCDRSLKERNIREAKYRQVAYGGIGQIGGGGGWGISGSGWVA